MMAREVNVFQLISHPDICGLYRLSTTCDALLLFMEFASGEREAHDYFIQLFAGVRHLHLHRFVAHRDLKLENILLGKNCVVKLADFGLAGTSCQSLRRTFVGTLGFQAPEILTGWEYNEKCDVWSLWGTSVDDGERVFAVFPSNLKPSVANGTCIENSVPFNFFSAVD
jgi:5'-AMP-activated protein kinase catalytic alpha subunit